MSVPPSGTYAGQALGLPVLAVVVGDGQVELRSARRLPEHPPPRVCVHLPRDAVVPAGIGAHGPQTQTLTSPRMAS